MWDVIIEMKKKKVERKLYIRIIHQDLNAKCLHRDLSIVYQAQASLDVSEKQVNQRLFL